MALIKCSCGTTNRVPSLPKTKVRCGKCQHVFGPAELATAQPEPPPTAFQLEQEEDGPLFDDEDDELDWTEENEDDDDDY